MEDGRKKIFLVDDTEFSLIRTKQILKEYYAVYTLDSSSGMFDLLKKVKPDLIVMDINMPGMDGYEAITVLKNDERYQDIPVIFLSGRIDEDSIIKGLSLGAVEHISKPYDPKNLHVVISKHLYPVQYEYELHIDEDRNVNRVNRQHSVLAVDDSPSMLRSIHFALKSKYKVHTLQKPENLEKIIPTLKPDLFLLDFNMPSLNGFELVKIIHSFEYFKNAPIIFLTSDSSPDHINAALKLGARDYILKPFNPNKLRDKIAKCLIDIGQV